MRDEINFNDHSGRKDERAQNQEADAAIEKDAAHHDQRRKQSEAGKKLEAADDFEEVSGKKPARL